MTVMTAIRSAETEEAKTAADRTASARALLPQDAALVHFFDALYASAVPDDVLRARPDQLAALAMLLHAEAGKRAAGAIHVAALDVSHETVLVGINDDRPFLFDSALQAAMAGGARIRAAFHPILDLNGVRTSVIALVCDALSGEMRQKLVDSLRDTFAQGQLTVRDWKPMLARAAVRTIRASQRASITPAFTRWCAGAAAPGTRQSFPEQAVVAQAPFTPSRSL